jgi:hypothetical protein
MVIICLAEDSFGELIARLVCYWLLKPMTTRARASVILDSVILDVAEKRLQLQLLFPSDVDITGRLQGQQAPSPLKHTTPLTLHSHAYPLHQSPSITDWLLYWCAICVRSHGAHEVNSSFITDHLLRLLPTSRTCDGR